MKEHLLFCSNVLKYQTSLKSRSDNSPSTSTSSKRQKMSSESEEVQSTSTSGKSTKKSTKSQQVISNVFILSIFKGVIIKILLTLIHCMLKWPNFTIILLEKYPSKHKKEFVDRRWLLRWGIQPWYRSQMWKYVPMAKLC
jgi:hypothetical protein